MNLAYPTMICCSLLLPCSLEQPDEDKFSIHLVHGSYPNKDEVTIVTSTGKIALRGEFTGWSFSAQSDTFILLNEKGVWIVRAEHDISDPPDPILFVSQQKLPENVDWQELTFHFFCGNVVARTPEGDWFDLTTEGELTSFPFAFWASDFFDFANPELTETCLLPARSNTTGLVGFLDKDFEWKVPPAFKNAQPFNDGLALIQDESDRFFFVDQRGRRAFDLDFEPVGVRTNGHLRHSNFVDGVALVSIRGEDRYVDIQGNILFLDSDFYDRFEYLSAFSEGLAAVKTANDSIGFIDRTGTLAIQPVFDGLGDWHFSSGVVQVSSGNKSFWFNREGTELEFPTNIVPAQISRFENGIATLTSRTGNSILVSTSGEIVFQSQTDGSEDR